MRQQFGMRAALDDDALIEHQNLVGADDGREPVGDDQSGAVFRDAVERILNIALGVAVERGRGLVEKEDRRRLEDGAGDGDTLLFAAGELEAALADFGFVAFRRQPDEAVDLRHPRRLLHLGVGRVPAAVADVVTDGVVEQHRVLRDHADGGAQRCLRDVADIFAVDQDPPAGHVVEAEQQPRNRRLARARRPDDGDGASGGDVEAQALEDRPFRFVSERDILEADACRRAH